MLWNFVCYVHADCQCVHMTDRLQNPTALRLFAAVGISLSPQRYLTLHAEDLPCQQSVQLGLSRKQILCCVPYQLLAVLTSEPRRWCSLYFRGKILATVDASHYGQSCKTWDLCLCSAAVGVRYMCVGGWDKCRWVLWALLLVLTGTPTLLATFVLTGTPSLLATLVLTGTPTV
jgi:hypothetical protein